MARRTILFVLAILALVASLVMAERLPGEQTAADHSLDTPHITAGAFHTCILVDRDGPANDGGPLDWDSFNGVNCWGANPNGELGTSTEPEDETFQPVDVCRTEPLEPDCEVLQNVRQVEAGTGAAHTCALLFDTSIKCWGLNSRGQLGNGTTADSAVPVAVTGLSGVSALAGGYWHTCALMGDGGVKCWGDNQLGALGDGTTTSRSTPVDVCATGETYPCTNLLSDVVALAAGGHVTCAIKLAGGVTCWGANRKGQLGDATTEYSTTPIDVQGLQAEDLPIRLVGVGGVGQGPRKLEAHVCALTASGNVKCWGSNEWGELGLGTVDGDPHSAPDTVIGLPEGTATRLHVGPLYNCVILDDATAHCWGQNDWGQLGNGKETVTEPDPVQVCAEGEVDPCNQYLTGVTELALGYYHTCAIMSVGVQCWGESDDGQLANDESLVPHMCSTQAGDDPCFMTPVDALVDRDSDGCQDRFELSGDENIGGRRDPNNPWDYFNPTDDGMNRVDDIIAVAAQFGIDYPDPNYTYETDRTALGPNDWNLGEPNSQQRVDDTLHAVKQFGHDCGPVDKKLPPWPFPK